MPNGAVPGPTSTEPVSPELILVAPAEDAQSAREQLPDAPAKDWDEFLVGIRQRTEVHEAAPEERRGGWSRRTLLGVVVACVITAVAASFCIDRLTGHREAVPAAAQNAPQTTASGTLPAPPAKPPTRATRPPSTQRKPGSSAFAPARAFSWPARPGTAKRYVVRFFRNGRKVLQIRTVRSRIVVPKRFTFRPGRYHWTVVVAGVQGRPLVDSRFVVPAAP